MNGKVNKKVLLSSGIAALVLVFALLVAAVLEGVVKIYDSRISYIHAGERWSANGDEYAVTALYTEADAGVPLSTVEMWVNSVDRALVDASVVSSGGGRTWAYAYSAKTELSVKGPKGRCAAEVFAVGGDFFLFHELDYLYGSGFLSDTGNPMGVVLDRDLAWQIFGAENIVGMEMEVDGEFYTVVGIVEPVKDSAVEEYTYGERPVMYMSYAGYSKVGGASITCFETALPNYVDEFADGIFTSAVMSSTDRIEVIEASSRFSFKNRVENTKGLKFVSIAKRVIDFPYWENTARYYDHRAAKLTVAEIVFLALAGVSFLSSFILLRLSGYTVTDSIKNTVKKIQKSQKKKNKKKKHKKHKTTTPTSGKMSVEQKGEVQ